MHSPELQATDYADWPSGVQDLFFDGGGVAIKASRIPPGTSLTKHAHNYDHISFLSQGSVILEIGGSVWEYHAPCVLLVKAGDTHKVTTIGDQDVVWLCIHDLTLAEAHALPLTENQR